MAEIRREKILIEKKLYDAQLQYFAKNDQKIYDYNYQAVKESIERAIKGEPTAKDVVSQKSSAEHPFGKVKV